MPVVVSSSEPRNAESMMASNRWFDRLALNTRIALALGFGGLLLIITLAGVDTLRVLKQIRHNGDEIREEFLFRNHVLNNIRSDLYLSGTYVRDYLLEPDSKRAESYRSTLGRVRTEMDSALEMYGSRIGPEESPDYTTLKTELARYWEVLDSVVRLNQDERHRKGYVFLRDEVFPRRTAMLDIANRIADINEQQLSEGRERGSALLSSFQNRLSVTVVVSVLLSIGMATFSMKKILNAETLAHAQYEAVAEARKQLEHLSASL